MDGWVSWLLGPGHFVHRLDPVLFEVGGVYLWYYGLSYSLGFVGLYWWLRRIRERLCLSVPEVYELSSLVALAVLLMGRAVEVLYYEWPYYGTHPREVLNYWQGGMSSHGLLLGGCLGAWIFARARGRAFLEIVDGLAVPGAILLAIGRIGNFFDGQIVGSVTDAWWAVKFPDTEGFRHPVVLYDALKNLLIVPVLLLLRRRAPAPGNQLAHFVFWYGAGRLFVDVFREYPAQWLGLGTGQYLNLAMAAGGVGLMLWLTRRPAPIGAPRVTPVASSPERSGRCAAMAAKRLAFLVLIAFPLLIPSDWTQDVPVRYAKRHPLRPSTLYHPIDPRP